MVRHIDHSERGTPEFHKARICILKGKAVIPQYFWPEPAFDLHNFLQGISMNTLLRNILAGVGVAFATQAAAQVTFYEYESFQGRAFTTERQISNFSRRGLDNHAASAKVQSDRWEVCEAARFKGRCVVLRPGRYPSLAAMG